MLWESEEEDEKDMAAKENNPSPGEVVSRERQGFYATPQTPPQTHYGWGQRQAGNNGVFERNPFGGVVDGDFCGGFESSFVNGGFGGFFRDFFVDGGVVVVVVEGCRHVCWSSDVVVALLLCCSRVVAKILTVVIVIVVDAT